MNNDRIFQCRPIHRNTDPVTSQLADMEYTKSGKQARDMMQVVDALRGYDSVTSNELSSLSGLDRYQCARRLSDARERSLVYNDDKRHCKITGKLCLTWRVR